MAAKAISDTLSKAQSAVMPGSQGAKIADLGRNTVSPDSDSRITSDFGTRQSSTDDWLRVVSDEHTGPSLLEDPFGREKIHRFDHERIPERVVHARGAAAHGKFTLHKSLAHVTKAGVLTDTSRETPVFLRFSTVLGSRGSADTVRDVRGFAVKFYTHEGNWDLVGNNIPVVFIQDAIKFPDVIHAAKPEPHNEVPQAQTAHNNFWDFMFQHSEATHMFMWAMSDRAIPRSYRMMQGFGVNTYTLINDKGERHFVKFHFTPELGVHSFVWDEALKLAGQDPDFHRKDLYEAIDNAAFPRWRFGVQLLPESREHDFDFDILDATKIWPEDLVPVEYVGTLELNRNVDEYFPETEQVAFCTSHIVPGIGLSDDPLLQGRAFSYTDTQITRLGTNWQELPINRPVCPVMNFNRDGQLRHTITKGKVNYWPNRFGMNPPAKPEEGGYVDYAQKIAGIKARTKSAKFADHISQAQLFLNSMSPVERSHMLSAFSFELDHCDEDVVYKNLVSRLAVIDPDFAQLVAQNVGVASPPQKSSPSGHPPVVNTGKKAPGLSQFDHLPDKPTAATRRVAILIADGYDGPSVAAMKAALDAASAIPFVIAPRRGNILAASQEASGHGEPESESRGIRADHHFEGQRSTMFDAVYIPGGKQSVATLAKSGRAMHWIREAFGHLKAIAASGEGVDLVRAALGPNLNPPVALSDGGGAAGETVDSYGVVTLRNVNPDGLREAVTLAKGATGFLEKFFQHIAMHRCWARELDGLHTQVAY